MKAADYSFKKIPFYLFDYSPLQSLSITTYRKKKKKKHYLVLLLYSDDVVDIGLFENLYHIYDRHAAWAFRKQVAYDKNAVLLPQEDE